ncbi:MAG TPA: heme exporter protein CcmB [Acidimicrobiales bacterium]|jgi:heme exporter protein B|nr:heme exporter protein CcmB [Acidimicrobiales bacterium]
MLHDAVLVFGKDIRIERRSRVALNQIVPFALTVAILFGLALGPDRSSLQPAAAGLFWVAVLLSAVLAVQRSFAVESADAARDGLRLSGLDPAGIFLGKALAVAAELLVLEVVLSVVVALLYGAALAGAAVLAAACVLGTVGLAAVGTLYGVLSSGLKVRDTLLPLLFLPVVAPVLLAATKAWGEALSKAPGQGGSWLSILAVFAIVYVAVGIVAFGPLLEDA